MAQHDALIIAVVGTTGLQGGAVTHRLLTDHWRVRALTRNPDGEKARALVERGAEVAQRPTCRIPCPWSVPSMASIRTLQLPVTILHPTAFWSG
jgi:NAD(P)-dependent dehydrogenase (short-subunit alcohol dehydrogenase family)